MATTKTKVRRTATRAKAQPEAESNGRTKYTPEVIAKVQAALTKKGATTHTVSEAMDIPLNFVQWFGRMAEIADEDRITWKTDAELIRKVTKAKDDDGLSLNEISLRSGLSRAEVNRIYKRGTGQEGVNLRAQDSDEPKAKRSKAQAAKPATRKPVVKRGRKAASSPTA